jgi:hypothetical protein
LARLKRKIEDMIDRTFKNFLYTALAMSVVSCGIDPADFAIQENVFPPVILATAHQIEAGEVFENRYIVAFKIDAGAKGFVFKSFQAEHRHHFTLLADTYLSDPGIKDIHYITTIDLADPKDPETSADIAPPAALQLAWESNSDRPESAISVVDFSDHESAVRVLKQWEEEGRIWFAEPDHLSHLDTTLQSPFSSELATEYKNSSAWHLKEVRLPEALETLATKQLTDVRIPVVAVLDSGVDTSHPSLEGRIWTNPSPGQSGCDNDVLGCDTTVFIRGKIGVGNSFPYLTTGPGMACPTAPVDATKELQQEIDTCEHGTHVAGLVVGKVNANSGGTCPVCQVMPIKIISKIGKKGSASDSAILQGFKYLNLFKSKTNIVRVANSSFGKFVRSRAVALLVSVLKKSPNEVLVVGAAGNEDSMIRSYPAAFNDAIAVSSLGSTLEKSNFSNFGPWVDVAAPGGDGDFFERKNINSTIPGNLFTTKPGTSMAAPIVAGIAGLVLAYDPSRSWKDLRRSIVDMADPRVYDPSIYNNYNFYYQKQTGESIRRPLLGSGIVDANAALDGKKATGVFGGRLSRVQRGCSAVGGEFTSRFSTSFALFLLPFLSVFVFALMNFRTSKS